MAGPGSQSARVRTDIRPPPGRGAAGTRRRNWCAGGDSLHRRERTRHRLGRRAAARRHRQGRHRQDDGGRGAGPRACLARPERAAHGSRRPAGHSAALRLPAASLRGAEGRRGPGQRAGPGRRRLRARRGSRAGVARVPGHVLQPAPRGPGADQARGGGLRDHPRPRPARRAAHRQGRRGGAQAQGPPARLRRGGHGRPAHRADRPVPQRGQPRCPGWPGWARSAATRTPCRTSSARRRPRCTSSPCWRRCRCRRPSTGSRNCATRSTAGFRSAGS